MRRRFKHVCVDLETLATVPGAVVLEIGAVAFDLDVPEEEWLRFSREVAMRAPDQQERVIDVDTLDWWTKRAKEGAVIPGLSAGMDLADAVRAFFEWFRQHEAEDCRVWAWGMDFDFGILKNAADQIGEKLPWRYNNQRCARTLCQELGVSREGEVTHEACWDAVQEARAVVAALSSLRREE